MPLFKKLFLFYSLIILSAGNSFASIDNVNRLTKKTITGKGIAHEQSLTYFANGQIKAITELLADKSLQIQKKTVDYRYDKLGRLTKSATIDPILGNETVEYSYDKVGNRLSQKVNGVETKYTYNANDWLLQAGAIAYTYDANGNTLTETDGSNVKQYAYNAENKLIKQTANGQSASFAYNPNGLRIAKTIGTTKTTYFLDSMSVYGDVVAEYQNGAKSKTYTLGDDLISQTLGGNTYYFGYDGLGSTRVLFDSTGAVSDSYDYTAFGEMHGETGTTDNEFKFTGEQFDDMLGMYNLRARYYAPEVGRFYGLDTYQGQISDPNSLHKYLYTGNDPVNMVDPTGKFSIMGVSISVNIGGHLRGMNLRGSVTIFRKILTDLATSLGPKALKHEFRRCVRTRGKRCRFAIPIIVYGNDIPSLTDHVADALTGAGSEKVPVNRFKLSYFRRTGARPNLCDITKRADAEKKYGSVDCDEYPMFRTNEWQRGKNVSYRYVKRFDNRRAGGLYGALVRLSAMRKGDNFLVAPVTWWPSLIIPFKK